MQYDSDPVAPACGPGGKAVHGESHRRTVFGQGCGPYCRRTAVTVPRRPGSLARVPRGALREWRGFDRGYRPARAGFA